jgi:signal peptidase
MKQVIPIPILIVTVYLLTNLVVPLAFRGEMIFMASLALWALVIAPTILISKLYQTTMCQTDKPIVQLASIIAALQIFFAVFAGFFMGFGKNSTTWTPRALAIYFPFLLIPFLGIELSRAYLTRTISRRKPTLTLFLISLFYTLILTSTPAYQSLSSPLSMSEFLIKSFIPALAISLLATDFAFLGGFPANLAFMAIPAFFTWFSPILPNPPWAVQSIITVTAATIGFLVLDQTVKPFPTHKIYRTLKKQKSQLPYWTALALIGLIAIWSSTGLLGFTPTIIASGSMQPTLNPGDITIIISTPPATIKIGDTIQYYTSDVPIIHRVIDKYETGGSLWFITQGDANTEPDDPVNERQVIGKTLFTIPQLGWVSIALKNLAANTYTFLTTTLPQTLTTAWTQITTNGVYITSALAFTAYSFLLLTYKNRKKEEKT